MFSNDACCAPYALDFNPFAYFRCFLNKKTDGHPSVFAITALPDYFASGTGRMVTK